MSLARPLPLGRLCRLAQVSRAGFYRWRQAPEEDPGSDLDLRDHIQRIALEFPSYGWRRVTAELRRRQGTVNHKLVRRILQEDNLLCLRCQKFVVTTDSDHDLPIYPNLARGIPRGSTHRDGQDLAAMSKEGPEELELHSTRIVAPKTKGYSVPWP